MTKPTALVTGASRGIGRGIALELSKAGYRVAINYASNEVAAQEVLTLITQSGGEGFIVKADIAKASDCLLYTSPSPRD